MKFRKKQQIALIVSSVGICSSLYAYVVQPKDTLSDIALKKISPYVYTKDGSLKMIRLLNPQIKEISRIYPGQVIFLGTFEDNYGMDPKRVAEANTNTNKECNVAATPANEAEPVSRNISATPSGMASYTISPEYALLNLSATDSRTGGKAIVDSSYYVGLKLAHSQNWSETFQTNFYAKIAQIAFEEPTQSTKTLDNKTKFLSSVGFGTSHHLSPAWNANLFLEYGKELFLRGKTSTRIAVDAVNIPTVGGKLSYILKEENTYQMGIAGLYAAKFPTKTQDYNVKLGHEFGASLFIARTDQKHPTMQTELGLRHRTQNTSITDQDENRVFLNLTVFFGK